MRGAGGYPGPAGAPPARPADPRTGGYPDQDRPSDGWGVNGGWGPNETWGPVPVRGGGRGAPARNPQDGSWGIDPQAGRGAGGPATGGWGAGGPATGGWDAAGPSTGGWDTGSGPISGPIDGWGSGQVPQVGRPTSELGSMVGRRATSRPARAVLRDSSRLAVPGWWRILTASLGWTSVTIAIAFWVGEGGVHDLTSGLAGGLTSLGQLAGLVSADLLMLQVLMMARVPLLERTYGQDGLLHIHRTLGFTSLNLLLAHIALVTVGYAGTGKVGVVKQFVDFVGTYSGVLLATAATGLLVLVAVTSIRAARKRQRYETWHLIHLYAYLGVGLSIPHELAVGGAFTENKLATLYWWGIYLLAAGAVLLWRMALPLYRLLRHGLIVEKVVREGPGVVSVHMRGRNLGRLNAGAGQFFLWRFLSGRGWTRAHPYSLSAAPGTDRLRITVKDLGDDSHRLAQLRPGTRVLAEGPFGRLHAGVRTQDKVTLFAAGIGITPMRALLEELDCEPGDLNLIYRGTDERDIVLAREIDQLAQQKGARVHYLIGPRRRSRRGGSWLPQAAGTISDVEALVRLVPDIAEHDVYMCGPDAWLDSVIHALRRAGVPPERIHLERFSW